MPSMFEFGPAQETLRRIAGDPLHAQISNAIRTRITSGDWEPGHRLAPEPQLAEEIGVSRGTLRRALATLSEEGLLRQTPGRGTFVSDTPGTPATPTLSTLAEDFLSQGIDLLTRVIESSLVSPPFAVAELLGLDAGVRVLGLVRVRSVEGQPVALLHNYVREDLAPGIDQIDFSTATLFGTLEHRYGLELAEARRSFSAVSAPEDIALNLELPAGVPVQYLEQLTLLADGTPVEYSDVWIDSRQLRVVTHLNRHPKHPGIGKVAGDRSN